MTVYDVREQSRGAGTGIQTLPVTESNPGAFGRPFLSHSLASAACAGAAAGAEIIILSPLIGDRARLA